MTRLRGTLGQRKACFRETWYGEAEPYRGGYRLMVLIGPRWPLESFKKDIALVFDVGKELVPGPMVMATERSVWLPLEWWHQEIHERVEVPRGKPERLVDVSYDPSKTDGYGAWQGRITGSWGVRLTRVKRKSIWARLRS